MTILATMIAIRARGAVCALFALALAALALALAVGACRGGAVLAVVRLLLVLSLADAHLPDLDARRADHAHDHVWRETAQHVTVREDATQLGLVAEH